MPETNITGYINQNSIDSEGYVKFTIQLKKEFFQNDKNCNKYSINKIIEDERKGQHTIEITHDPNNWIVSYDDKKELKFNYNVSKGMKFIALLVKYTSNELDSVDTETLWEEINKSGEKIKNDEIVKKIKDPIRYLGKKNKKSVKKKMAFVDFILEHLKINKDKCWFIKDNFRESSATYDFELVEQCFIDKDKLSCNKATKSI